MSDPLIILLVLTAGEATDPATAAAASRTLGAGTTVLVEERSELPSDADALTLGERVHARAIAEVRWDDEAHTRVLVHVHVADGADWLDREITFDAADVPAERGRTIGLALATMISNAAAREPAVAPRTPEVPGKAPESPAPAPSSGRRVAVWHAAVDASALGSFGVGGSAGGVGAGLAGRWYASSALAFRGAAGARFGNIAPALTSLTTLSLGAGAAWRMLVTSGPEPFELGLRADGLLLEQTLRHRTSGSVATRSRWISGADLCVEADWYFTTRLAITGALGAEFAFGPTGVNVGSTRVAELPILRGFAELGVRARF